MGLGFQWFLFLGSGLSDFSVVGFYPTVPCNGDLRKRWNVQVAVACCGFLVGFWFLCRTLLTVFEQSVHAVLLPSLRVFTCSQGAVSASGSTRKAAISVQSSAKQ